MHEYTRVSWIYTHFVGYAVRNGILLKKALASYKGSFQYINYAFAGYLPEYIEFINREQDLGDEGLRQAKMTYKPIKFIKKYRILS